MNLMCLIKVFSPISFSYLKCKLGAGLQNKGDMRHLRKPKKQQHRTTCQKFICDPIRMKIQV